MNWDNELAVQFAPFPSVARLSRDMVVTEKIDGTNAQVTIVPRIPGDEPLLALWNYVSDTDGQLYSMYVGSRHRWITLDSDNFGFAHWAWANSHGLALLGPGSHFGEWWGQGIQRGYGLKEKRFSLFNTGRWTSHANTLGEGVQDTRCVEVPVCHVVPVLMQYTFNTEAVDSVLRDLAFNGSYAAPGFMIPEGVVVYHVASRQSFKKTLDKHDGHKSAPHA